MAEKNVRIRLFKDNSRYKGDLFVSVNGVNYKIRRGVEVEVPAYVAEVLDKEYPQYQFAKHKGYGTKLHYQMLDEFGPCPEHRRTFLKKWEARR